MKEQSPIIFWLLLAATICIDTVAVVWVFTETLNRSEALYYGLSCGQLSVLCIWVAFRARSQYWWWLPPAAVVLLVAVLSYGLFDSAAIRDVVPREIALANAGLLLSQAALLLSVLWVFQQTAVAQAWGPSDSARWRFSLKQVFIVMTATAIILISLRQSKLIREVPIPVLIWVINNVLLATAILVIQKSRLHRIMRLAITAGIAMALGLVIRLISSGQANGVSLNLIQAIILFTWLEFGEIGPESVQAPSDSA